MSNLSQQTAGVFQAPAQQVQTLLQQGMGFLSPTRCMDPNSHYNENNNPWAAPPPKPVCPDPPACMNDPITGTSSDCANQVDAWNRSCATADNDWNSKNVCKNMANVTPGYAVASQITTALNMDQNSTMMQMGLGNDLAAIFDALINKFMQEGLDALASKVNPEPPPNNWSYDGQCLSGDSCADTTDNNPLNIPQNVSVNIGETATVEITGGKPIYSIKDTIPYPTPDTTIATASVDGAILSVTGMGVGQTTVTIKDSRADNPRKVTVNITVVNTGGLMVVPANIVTDVSGDLTATVSGGTAPYSMTKNSDESIAIANFSGTSLIVVGIASGKTSVTITDSSSPAQSVTVPIAIGATGQELSADPSSVSAGIGEVVTSTISGGVGDYTIDTDADTTIATTSIDSNGTLTITGNALGTTSVTIKDSSATPKTVTVDINIESSSQPGGLTATPQNASVYVGDTSNVGISGGKPVYIIDAPLPNESIAHADMNTRTNTLKISGISPGHTTVTIRDSHRNVRTVTVDITVLSSPPPAQ